jgi:RimJ/RimL family protein N-acetyltransferase
MRESEIAMDTQQHTKARVARPFREGGIPVLETERLILRAPRLDEAKAVARLANDRRIAENTARIPHPYRLADAEDFITAVNTGNDEVAYVIIFAGDVVGCCGLAEIGGPALDLSYWIGAAFRGNGYATEAARRLIDHAFTDLGHEAVQAGVRVTNPASRRVVEKCGFQWTRVGLMRIRALASSVPIECFCLDRRTWASIKNWSRVERVASM